jgi:SAM-dependent methyltransferase
MTFKDHFSSAAQLYVDARPRYPDALIDFVADVAPSRGQVWDAGCGNGQASLALAERFTHVLATDPSAEQIARAPAHERVRFLVERAEHSSADLRSCDAVTVAQALHWFDLPLFFDEVRRVLRPQGVLVAWGYSAFHVSPAFDEAFTAHVLDAIEPDWPPENQLLWHGYETIMFPGVPIEAPALDVEATWTLEALLAYVQTWSGVRRHRERTGHDVVVSASGPLAVAFGEARVARNIRMPIHLVARRFE